MNTRITTDDNSISVTTEFRRTHYFDAGFREVARAYHSARAGQALENAIDNGCVYLSTSTALAEYWEDADLALKDTMVLFTRFRMRMPNDRS